MAARKQFLLRVDPELWKELEKWAADELRSVNAQVEWVLRDAVKKRGANRAFACRGVRTGAVRAAWRRQPPCRPCAF